MSSWESVSVTWEQKIGIALHYCIEGRILILTAKSLNPAAYKQLTSTITNLSQRNIQLALDLALPKNVIEYVTQGAANIHTKKEYNFEVELVSELLADYEEVMGEPHALDAVLPVLRNTVSSLTFSDTDFDPTGAELDSILLKSRPAYEVSRANISNFVCTQIGLGSGAILRSLGYTPDLTFADTSRSNFLPSYFSPRTGIGEYAGY
tara:strand:- start:3423 stop:4043 length:621 start_codon:yes stop_codon:yes gene_type:complete